MTKVIMLDGVVLNIGPWDFQVYQADVVGNPFDGDGEPPSDWDFQIHQVEVIGNPLPEGAIATEVEIVESEKGRLLAASDWYNLRKDSYPPVKDQLDAYWKGGEAAESMRATIMAVKEKYPKVDAQ